MGSHLAVCSPTHNLLNLVPCQCFQLYGTELYDIDPIIYTELTGIRLEPIHKLWTILKAIYAILFCILFVYMVHVFGGV